jgi:hypothetical protein
MFFDLKHKVTVLFLDGVAQQELRRTVEENCLISREYVVSIFSSLPDIIHIEVQEEYYPLASENLHLVSILTEFRSRTVCKLFHP